MADGLALFSMMAQKMRWHGANQALISQNIANADTPSYKPKELKAPDFRDVLKSTTTNVRPPRMVATHAGHVQLTSDRGQVVGSKNQDMPYETAPDGNAVILEEQMMKASQNAMDHQMITHLYQRYMGMMQTALETGR